MSLDNDVVPLGQQDIFTSAEKFKYGLRALRVIAASKSEGIAAKVLSQDKRFIRAFEGMKCDGGYIMNNEDAQDLPEDMTD